MNGTQIVVAAKEKSARMRSYWTRHLLPFAGIADPRGTLLQQHRQEWRWLKLGRMPALFVVDRRQRVAYVHYGNSMADIPDNDTILAVLQSLPG
jgi:peroxiredoxin